MEEGERGSDHAWSLDDLRVATNGASNERAGPETGPTARTQQTAGKNISQREESADRVPVPVFADQK